MATNFHAPPVYFESILLALDPGTDKEMLHECRLSKFELLDESERPPTEEELPSGTAFETLELKETITPKL